MKVTNNRAKSATVFYKIQGKMKKVKLLPFESFTVRELTDINAVKNNMTIANFIGSDRAAYYATVSAITTLAIATANTYNDGQVVSTRQFVDTGTTYVQGNFANTPYYSASTPVATFSRRKTPLTRQTKGRFEIKYR